MNKFLSFFSLLLITISLSASDDWLYYKEFPWVYNHKTKDWLYLSAGKDLKIYAYSNRAETWEEFKVKDDNSSEKTWEDQYEEWLQNPEPYGGLEALQFIKQAKDEERDELLLIGYQDISDLSPLKGLTELEKLTLGGLSQPWSDLAPLKGLSALTELFMTYSNLSDLSVLSTMTNLNKLGIENNLISDFSKLSSLKNLEFLSLRSTRTLDISFVSGFKKLKELYLSDTEIADITPVTSLSNLEYLSLYNITESQKAILQAALPNTNINFL